MFIQELYTTLHIYIHPGILDLWHILTKPDTTRVFGRKKKKKGLLTKERSTVLTKDL